MNRYGLTQWDPVRQTPTCTANFHGLTAPPTVLNRWRRRKRRPFQTALLQCLPSAPSSRGKIESRTSSIPRIRQLLTWAREHEYHASIRMDGWSGDTGEPLQSVLRPAATVSVTRTISVLDTSRRSCRGSNCLTLAQGTPTRPRCCCPLNPTVSQTW